MSEDTTTGVEAPLPEQDKGEPKKTRKPRVVRPKVEKATGKVIVLAATADEPNTVRPTEKQPDAKLRTKKALEKWIKTNCGAGTYAAVRTIVKVQITEEVITSKKAVVL